MSRCSSMPGEGRPTARWSSAQPPPLALCYRRQGSTRPQQGGPGRRGGRPAQRDPEGGGEVQTNKKQIKVEEEGEHSMAGRICTWLSGMPATVCAVKKNLGAACWDGWLLSEPTRRNHGMATAWQRHGETCRRRPITRLVSLGGCCRPVEI